jgi:hypothetical protein
MRTWNTVRWLLGVSVSVGLGMSAAASGCSSGGNGDNTTHPSDGGSDAEAAANDTATDAPLDPCGAFHRATACATECPALIGRAIDRDAGCIATVSTTLGCMPGTTTCSSVVVCSHDDLGGGDYLMGQDCSQPGFSACASSELTLPNCGSGDAAVDGAGDGGGDSAPTDAAASDAKADGG